MINAWRVVSDDYENPVCEMLCCDTMLNCGGYQVIKFEFCPFCREKLGEQLKCRLSATPKWAYRWKEDHMGEVYSYGLTKHYEFPPETRVFWEIQIRKQSIWADPEGMSQDIIDSYQEWTDWNREFSLYEKNPLDEIKRTMKQAATWGDNEDTNIEWRLALVRFNMSQREQRVFGYYQPKWAKLDFVESSDE